MRIKDIGGEFALIKRLTKKPKDKSIIRGIGDDAAVIKVGNKLLAVTTDTLVEGDHFSLKWFTAEQVGMKAIEINASDIGAMGAVPKYVLVSLILPIDIEVSFIDRLYKGMRSACDKYKCEIIGKSAAGLNLFVNKMSETQSVSEHAQKSSIFDEINNKNKRYFKSVIKAHTEPKAQFYKVKGFLKYINAMIDVSDGLVSEVTRICEQSNCGAVIYTDNVPIADETRKAAEAVGKNAVDYALFGGEDFELVYTVSEKNLNKVKGFIVGEIRKKKGVYLHSNGKEELVKKKGYDHFE